MNSGGSAQKQGSASSTGISMAQKKAGVAPGQYRKPPVEYQFKKGVSGNPKGRPKKTDQSAIVAFQGGAFDRVGAMALEEATRMVTVREGNTVTQIPAIQALFRVMFRAAADGDTKTARQLLELVSRVEIARADCAVELLQFASQYQQEKVALFEMHERMGQPPPDIFPHPYDVIINSENGEVTIDGPTTKEEAGARMALLELAAKSLPRYFEVQEALKKDPKNAQLKHELAGLKRLVNFMKKESERSARHEARKQARQALLTTGVEISLTGASRDKKD